MILAGASTGASTGLLNKTIPSHCSAVSGSVSAAGGCQPHGSQCVVSFSHTPRLLTFSASPASSASSLCDFTTRALAGASAVANDVEVGGGASCHCVAVAIDTEFSLFLKEHSVFFFNLRL